MSRFHPLLASLALLLSGCVFFTGVNPCNGDANCPDGESCVQGNCEAGEGEVNLNTTVDLSDGAVATYTVTAPILSDASGTISNTATVTAVNETPRPRLNAGAKG